jgi:tol-pal system protein YbgF
MVDSRRQHHIAAMTSAMTRGLTAAALAASLCIPTASNAQDGGSPLSVLDRMFGKNSSAPQAAGQDTAQNPAQAPAADLVLRIERLEAQNRQLTGAVEQLQYRNRQLEAQIRSLGGTPGVMPGQQSMAPRPVPQGTPPGVSASTLPPAAAPPQQPGMSASALPPPATGRRADVFDPTQNPDAPGAPRPLGGVPGQPPAVVSADPPIGVPGGRGAGAPLDLSSLATGIATPGTGESGPLAAPGSSPSGPLPAPPARNLSATGAMAAVAPPSDSPKDYYDLAYGYVLRKDYALAEDAFTAFLKKFPQDRRAPDAQFWLGESLFQRQDYDAAASSFLDLSTKHGSHTKAPDALLRLAQSLAAMKQKEMACATLAEVTRKYPRASNSVKQGVVREQKRVHC